MQRVPFMRLSEHSLSQHRPRQSRLRHSVTREPHPEVDVAILPGRPDHGKQVGGEPDPAAPESCDRMISELPETLPIGGLDRVKRLAVVSLC